MSSSGENRINRKTDMKHYRGRRSSTREQSLRTKTEETYQKEGYVTVVNAAESPSKIGQRRVFSDLGI